MQFIDPTSKTGLVNGRVVVREPGGEVATIQLDQTGHIPDSALEPYLKFPYMLVILDQEGNNRLQVAFSGKY